MQASPAAYKLIESFESFCPNAYLCPAGIPTIGYGHTGGVKMTDKITQEEADRLLHEDVASAENAINTHCGSGLTQNEFDALVSFVFNVGVGNFSTSTLLRKVKAGDKVGASLEFERWIHSGSKVLPGLIRRREAERMLFRGENS